MLWHCGLGYRNGISPGKHLASVILQSFFFRGDLQICSVGHETKAEKLNANVYLVVVISFIIFVIVVIIHTDYCCRMDTMPPCSVLEITNSRTGCRLTATSAWSTTDRWSRRTKESTDVTLSTLPEKIPWLDISECSVIYSVIATFLCYQIKYALFFKIFILM